MIHVKDVNDNPPVFDRPTYEAQITEEDDRNLPKRILQVSNLEQKTANTYHIYYPPPKTNITCIEPPRRSFSLWVLF